MQTAAVLTGGIAGVLSFGVTLPENDETDEFVDGPETVMQVLTPHILHTTPLRSPEVILTEDEQVVNSWEADNS